MITFDDVTTFVGNLVGTVFGTRSGRILKRLAPQVEKINELEKEMERLTDVQLREKTVAFRSAIADLRRRDPAVDANGKIDRFLDRILPVAFAMVREAAKRTIGQRHFDVQLAGGIVLHRGMIAEMATGEGKTIVATLPCYLNALPRRPHEQARVHLVTTNDYLARRDAEWKGPLYEMLGLTCGTLQSSMLDSRERQEAYACDIVYGKTSEFGFDYLRDNMKMEPGDQVQQSRHFAIVDEADSILIDEARTPLIIAGAPDEDSMERYELAAKLARHLKPVPDHERDRMEADRLHGIFSEPRTGDYVVNEKDHTVMMTERGIPNAERFLGIENIYAGKHMDWPQFIDKALRAKELYKKEVDYLVTRGRDGKREVVLVDEFTGNLMYGRRWGDGLHQAVEAKERLAGEKIEMEAENQTLGTITIQNFFRLYAKLAGMTATAATESREFGKTYKLEVVSIPTNRPMIRADLADVIYGTEKAKWEAICQEIKDVHATGRPILVGTTSVEKSERLAALLEKRGLRGKFNVLNAKQHEREAQIIDSAGALGAITIATNMAGRGTDIKLQPFTLKQLVEHWQGQKLAPKRLDLDRPMEEIESDLYEYWTDTGVDHERAKAKPWQKGYGGLSWEGMVRRGPDLQISEHVRDLGGLHVIGSERHEARRIDNQLRGRSGRQGDPGSSRFFLSLDDDLMRIFARDWVRGYLQRNGMADGTPLESRLVSRAIEKAQRRVEEHHMSQRRNVLEYDEVMNQQRKLIYEIRNKVLHFDELKETMHSWIGDAVALAVQRETESPEATDESVSRKLAAWAHSRLGVRISAEALDGLRESELEDAIVNAALEAYDQRDASLGEVSIPDTVPLAYEPHELALTGDRRRTMVAEKIAQLGQIPLERMRPYPKPDPSRNGEIFVPTDATKPVFFDTQAIDEGHLPEAIIRTSRKRKMRLAERYIMLETIDTKWKDHLHDMDVLREGVHLQIYAQKDPKLEYKRSGYELFYRNLNSIKEQAADLAFKVEFEESIERQEVKSIWNLETAETRHDEAQSAYPNSAKRLPSRTPQPEPKPADAEGEIEAVQTIRRTEIRVGPNERCSCGSGRKFKKCCGRFG